MENGPSLKGLTKVFLKQKKNTPYALIVRWYYLKNCMKDTSIKKIVRR